MQDMVPKGTGNSRFLKSSIPENITHEELVALLRSGQFPVDFAGLNPAGIATQGTPLNKANLLRDETAAAFQLTGNNKTVDAALQKVAGSSALQRVGDMKSTLRDAGASYIACDGTTTDKQALSNYLMPVYFKPDTIALSAPNMTHIIKCGEYYVGFGYSTSVYVATDIMGPWSSISLNSNICNYVWTQDEWLYWISYSGNNALRIYRGKISKQPSYYMIQNEATVRNITLTNSGSAYWSVCNNAIVINNIVYVLIYYHANSGSYGYYVYNKLSINTADNTFGQQTAANAPLNSYAPLAGGTCWYEVALSNTTYTLRYFDVVTNTSKTINKDLATAFNIPVTNGYQYLTYAYGKFTACLTLRTAGGILFAYARCNSLADFENIADVFTVLTQYSFRGSTTPECSVYNNILSIMFTEDSYTSNNMQVSPVRMLLVNMTTAATQLLTYSQALMLPTTTVKIENPDALDLYYITKYGSAQQNGLAIRKADTSLFVPHINLAFIKGDDVV